MKSVNFKKICIEILTIIFVLNMGLTLCYADDGSATGGTPVVCYVNPETNYKIIIADYADYLTTEEKVLLMEDMKPITSQGNVVYYTYLHGGRDLASSCEYFYLACLGANEPGVMFAINPDELYIYAEGSMADIVTNRYANSIADNVYKKAMVDDYYGCASDSYHQIIALLNNKNIPEPMKYICNALLGLLLSFMICFLYAYFTSRIQVRKGALLEGGRRDLTVTDHNQALIKQDSQYMPVSSGGSGGHGHFGGGGHGGGGGHHHSGGGHRR